MSTHVGDLSQVTAIPHPIREKLHDVVHRHQSHERAFRFAGLVTLAIALLVAMITVDLIVEIELATWRWLGWLMAVGIAIAVGRWWQRSAGRPLSWIEAAWTVEAIRPDMEERLSSTIEILGQGAPPGAEEQAERVTANRYSPALIGALSAEASQYVATVKSNEVPVRATWPVVWALVGSCIVLLALTIASPAGVFCSLRNWLMPWAAPIFPALTAEVSPGDATIAEGATLEIRARLPHRTSPLALDFWSEELNRETIPMRATYQPTPETQNASPELSATLAAKRDDIFYRVRGGKRVSRTYRITVLPQPKIESITAHVIFPEYTGLPDEIVTDTTLPIPLLVGSKLTLQVHTDQNGEQAECTWTDRVRAPLLVENGVLEYTARIPGAYSGEIRVQSAQGIYSAPHPIKIQVYADVPPEIYITKPTLAKFQSHRDRGLTVEFDASDDLGVDRVELLYKALGTRSDEPPTVLETSLDRQLDAEQPAYRGRVIAAFRQLPEHASGVAVWLRAVDRRSVEFGGPQFAETPPMIIEFGTTVATPLEQQLAVDQQSIQRAVDNARQHFQLAQLHVEHLAEHLDARAWQQTDAESLNGLLDDAQQQLNEGQQALQRLASEIEHAQSDLSELAQNIRRLESSQVVEARHQLEQVPLVNEPKEQRENVTQAARQVASVLEQLEQLGSELRRKLEDLALAARLEDLADQQVQLADELDVADTDGQNEPPPRESSKDDESKDQNSLSDNCDNEDQSAESAEESSDDLSDEWRDRQQRIARELEQLQQTDAQKNREELERQAELAESLANRARELAEKLERTKAVKPELAESSDKRHPLDTDGQTIGEEHSDHQQQEIADELADLQQQSAELARGATLGNDAEQLARTAHEELRQSAESIKSSEAQSKVESATRSNNSADHQETEQEARRLGDEEADEQSDTRSARQQNEIATGEQDKDSSMSASEEAQHDTDQSNQQDTQSAKKQEADTQQVQTRDSPAESLRKASEALQQFCNACRECAVCENPGNTPSQSGGNRSSSSPASSDQLADAKQQCEDAAQSRSREQAQHHARDAARSLRELADRAGQETGLRKSTQANGNQPTMDPDNTESNPGQQPGTQPKGSRAATDQPFDRQALRGGTSSNWTRAKRQLSNGVLDGREAMIPEAYRGIVTDYFEALAKIADEGASLSAPTKSNERSTQTPAEERRP